MIKNFEGKTAFITGSASGIGMGIAHACAKHGMKVCIVDKREDALEEALKWYKLAAERGDRVAIYMLGHMYYHGDKVEQDYKEAYYWFDKDGSDNHEDK